MNNETMFVLQLHPLFRGVTAILCIAFGAALYAEGKASKQDCGEVISACTSDLRLIDLLFIALFAQGFVPLVVVCGVYLLFTGVVGFVVAAMRYTQVTMMRSRCLFIVRRRVGSPCGTTLPQHRVHWRDGIDMSKSLHLSDGSLCVRRHHEGVARGTLEGGEEGRRKTQRCKNQILFCPSYCA